MKTKQIKNIIILVLVICIVPLGTLYAQQTGVISNNYVRLRTEPATTSKVLMYVNNGDVVSIIDQTKNKQKIGKVNDYWYRVKLENDREGWVYGAFIKFAEKQETGKSEPAITDKFVHNVSTSGNTADIKVNEVLFYQDNSKSNVIKSIRYKKYNKTEHVDNFVKYGKDAYYVYNEVLLTTDGVLIKEITQMKDSKITKLDFYDARGDKTGSINVIFDYMISPDFKYVVIFPAEGTAGYYGEKIVFFNVNGKLINEYKYEGMRLLYNQAFSDNSDFFGLIRINQNNDNELSIFNREGNLVNKEIVADSRKSELKINNDGSYLLKKQ